MAEKLALNIFLLRRDRVAAFEEQLVAGHSTIPLSEPLDGFVLPLPARPAVPRWVAVIQSVVQNPAALTLTGQSPAAIMVIRLDGNTFALTFGHAWQKLEDEWVERDFGRRVALNSIAPDKLVEIHIEQVFAKWHVSRERAPRASSVDEFGVEFDRDLVAAVEGVSSVPLFGKTVRGGSSLRIEAALAAIAPALRKATSLFKSDAYKKRWPEVDNISPIRDPDLIAELEAQLDTDFASGAAQRKLVMFTPSYRREDVSPDSYVFGRFTASAPTSPYLIVESWLSLLRRDRRVPSVAEAKATPIHLLDEAKEEIRTTTAFDCFGYELALRDRPYILSSGVWYEVVFEFLTKVNKAASGIPSPKTNLPAWNGVETEGEYNVRCGRAKGFLTFDTKNVMYGGGQSKFEFCDVFHMESQTLYFAKIASKSSGMSHLVEQVRRTAELFFSVDGTYREQLVQVFKRQHKAVDNDWLKSRPRHGDWNLCLVSLGKSAAQLPFFARCALAKLCADLKKQGHEVSFLKV